MKCYMNYIYNYCFNRNQKEGLDNLIVSHLVVSLQKYHLSRKENESCPNTFIHWVGYFYTETILSSTGYFYTEPILSSTGQVTSTLKQYFHPLGRLLLH